MKKVLIGFGLFFAASWAMAQQTVYVERGDVESGRVVVTGPVTGSHTNVTVIYPPTNCRAPRYVPKWGGGCELLPGYAVPVYPTPFSSFVYIRR